MAINTTPTAMLSAYVDRAGTPGLLSSLFTIPAVGGIHNKKKIRFDNKIEDGVAAVPVMNGRSGYNQNDFTGYDMNEAVPPVYKEAVVVPASELGDIRPGMNPFESVSFTENAAEIIGESMIGLQSKILLAREIQAAQILTTGKLALTDVAGSGRYDLDFGLPTANFFNASTSWDGSADPVADIKTAAGKVRNPKKVIMDSASFDAAYKITSFKDRFVAPERGKGLAKFDFGMDSEFAEMYYGELIVGARRLELWVYDETYKLTPSGSDTQFLSNKCVVVGNARKDVTFGRIANFGIDPRARGLIPSRLTSMSRQVDMTLNAWISQDNESFNAGFGTRMLLIPRDKKDIACVTTIYS